MTERASEHLVQLLTRPGCHLCQPAREAITRVAQISGVRWEEIDVTSDPDLEREYGDRLPVVLLNGREHGYWRGEGGRPLPGPGFPPGP